MFTYQLEKDDPNKPKLLFYCANILGITPIMKYEGLGATILRVYPILLIFLMISTHFCQLIENMQDWKSEGVQMFPKACATFILYSMNIYMTCKFHFGNGMKNFQELLDKVLRVDQIALVYNTSNAIRTTRFISHIVLMITLLITSTILDITHAFRTETDSIKYIWMYNFNRLRLGIAVLLICYTTKRMLTALREIHDILTSLNKTSPTICLKETSKMEFLPHMDICLTLKYVCQMHVILTEAMAIFNKIYGFSIFLIDMFAITFFLVIFETIRFQLGNKMFDGLALVWTLLLVTIALVGPIWIASVCSKTTKESEKTAKLAYNLFYTLNLNGQCANEKMIAENLLILIKQASSCSFKFSAAGFFPVDYSGLYVIINLITSYTIVALQF